MQCFITDIDNTIADTRDRLRRSLEEIGRGEVFRLTSGSYGGFGEYLKESEEERFWGLFLSDRYLHLDSPAPGAAEFISRMEDAGIKIIYLTGRQEGDDSMRAGTESWLEEHGFPSPSRSGVDLFMKPRRKMEDKEFKLEKLREEFSGRPGSDELVGVGDHPNDALVYDRTGIRPVLLDWLGLFTRRKLRNSAPKVKIVESWHALKKEFSCLINHSK